MYSVQTDPDKILAIYNYLSTQDQVESANGVFVFGRADYLLAEQASDLIYKNFAKYVLFTGGLGKDSKYLTELNISEADFLAAHANIVCKLPTQQIFRETVSSNGGENAKNGLQTIIDNNLEHNHLLVLAHATSLRRLVATLEQECINRNLNVKLSKIATSYNFNPKELTDQKEAVSELVKLVDYAEKGWCKLQTDIPQDMYAYAKDLVL